MSENKTINKIRNESEKFFLTHIDDNLPQLGIDKNLGDISHIHTTTGDHNGNILNTDIGATRAHDLDNSIVKTFKKVNDISFFSPKSKKMREFSPKANIKPIIKKDQSNKIRNNILKNNAGNMSMGDDATNFNLKLSSLNGTENDLNNFPNEPIRKKVNIYHKILDKNRRRFNEIYKITPELVDDIKEVQKLKNKLSLDNYQNNLVRSFIVKKDKNSFKFHMRRKY